jgi:hypothetical protein
LYLALIDKVAIVSSPFQLLCAAEYVLSADVVGGAGPVFYVDSGLRRQQWRGVARDLGLDVRHVPRKLMDFPIRGRRTTRIMHVLSALGVAADVGTALKRGRPIKLAMGHYSDRVQRVCARLLAQDHQELVCLDDGVDSLDLGRRRSRDLSQQRVRWIDGPVRRIDSFYTAFPGGLVGCPEPVTAHRFQTVRTRLGRGRFFGRKVFVGQPLITLGLVDEVCFERALKLMANLHGVQVYVSHPRDTEKETNCAVRLGYRVVEVSRPLEIVLSGAIGVFGFVSTVLLTASLFGVDPAAVVSIRLPAGSVRPDFCLAFSRFYDAASHSGVRVLNYNEII